MSESATRTPQGLPRTPASTKRRTRTLDAFLDLVLEGNLPPTPEQVAGRAGISMATFFRYFESLRGLRRDAGLRLLERFPLLRVPDVGEGSLPDRIERFVEIRLALWEKAHLLARLQRTTAFQDPDAAQMIEAVRQLMAKEVREHFAPELDGLTAARRDDAVALIATLTSVESWEQFRETFGRSRLQTSRAWTQAILAIVKEGPTA